MTLLSDEIRADVAAAIERSRATRALTSTTRAHSVRCRALAAAIRQQTQAIKRS